VSLGQPWVRPIVRGKAKAKCEFGAKLDINVSNGFTRSVLADWIYRNKKNISFCQSLGIQILGKPLGRPKKSISEDDQKLLRKVERKTEIDRIEVERKFSHAKGSFGLGLIRTRLKETSLTSIALAILALNVAHIVRFFRAFFYEMVEWMENELKIINKKKYDIRSVGIN
jgi:hypothetical protein